MTAVYEITVKFTVFTDVDKIDETLKDPHEMATDICNTVCDENTSFGGVTMYEVIETGVNVK